MQLPRGIGTYKNMRKGSPGSDIFYTCYRDDVYRSDLRIRQGTEKLPKVFICIFKVILRTGRIWICKGIKRKRKTEKSPKVFIWIFNGINPIFCEIFNDFSENVFIIRECQKQQIFNKHLTGF